MQPAHDSVGEVSRFLQSLLSDIPEGKDFANKTYQTAAQRMKAVICMQIVQDCAQVRSAVPVPFNLPGSPVVTARQEREYALNSRLLNKAYHIPQYAIELQWFGLEDTVLLPCAVNPVGARSTVPDRSDRDEIREAGQYPWNQTELQQLFRWSPILNISDCELLTARYRNQEVNYFAQRKFSTTWYIHPCLTLGVFVGLM